MKQPTPDRRGPGRVAAPLMAMALGCQTAPSTAPPGPRAEAPAHGPIARAPAPAAAPERADATPHGDPDTPPADPPAPRLPDGREIEPCGTAPANMACIPGGPFVRGHDEGPSDARPAATVHLQTFYMDRYEVTNAEYRRCRAAGACPRRGPLYNDFSADRQPIVGVSWFAAVDYCTWAGKRLPTEAQWEKAARGPDGEAHPFGDVPLTCEHAVIADERGKSCGVKKRKEHPDKGRTFEVGSRPAGRYDLHDMAGNAWEWVADWASDSWVECGADCEGVDPAGPCGGALECAGRDRRVVKGGSWYWTASHAQGYARRSHFPQNEIGDFHHFGFRCAASSAEARALGPAPAPLPPEKPGFETPDR